jgi:hypothetical protein
LPSSARAFTRLSLSGGYLLTDHWRVQGNVFTDLPIWGFARNQPLNVGALFGVIRTW